MDMGLMTLHGKLLVAAVASTYVAAEFILQRYLPAALAAFSQVRSGEGDKGMFAC